MQQADADRKATVASRLNQARSSSPGADTTAVATTDVNVAPNSVTDEGRADKLELAQSGSDFSVATLSKLANRNGEFTQVGPNEGVLNLH